MIKITKGEDQNNDRSDEISNKAALKYLKFGREQNEYAVALVDESGYEIIKGYGNSTIEAINDMHNNLI